MSDAIRKALINGLFPPDGQEKLFVHVKTYQDISPSEDASKEMKGTPRYLCLTQKKALIKLLKVKKNTSNKFQISKTWPLNDIRQIEVMNSHSFSITLNKTYLFYVEKAKEKMIFLAFLIDCCKRSANHMPKLVNIDENRILMYLADPSAPTLGSSNFYDLSSSSRSHITLSDNNKTDNTIRSSFSSTTLRHDTSQKSKSNSTLVSANMSPLKPVKEIPTRPNSPTLFKNQDAVASPSPSSSATATSQNTSSSNVKRDSISDHHSHRPSPLKEGSTKYTIEDDDDDDSLMHQEQQERSEFISPIPNRNTTPRTAAYSWSAYKPRSSRPSVSSVFNNNKTDDNSKEVEDEEKGPIRKSFDSAGWKNNDTGGMTSEKQPIRSSIDGRQSVDNGRRSLDGWQGRPYSSLSSSNLIKNKHLSPLPERKFLKNEESIVEGENKKKNAYEYPPPREYVKTNNWNPTEPYSAESKTESELDEAPRQSRRSLDSWNPTAPYSAASHQPSRQSLDDWRPNHRILKSTYPLPPLPALSSLKTISQFSDKRNDNQDIISKDRPIMIDTNKPNLSFKSNVKTLDPLSPLFPKKEQSALDGHEPYHSQQFATNRTSLLPPIHPSTLNTHSSPKRNQNKNGRNGESLEEIYEPYHPYTRKSMDGWQTPATPKSSIHGSTYFSARHQEDSEDTSVQNHSDKVNGSQISNARKALSEVPAPSKSRTSALNNHAKDAYNETLGRDGLENATLSSSSPSSSSSSSSTAKIAPINDDNSRPYNVKRESKIFEEVEESSTKSIINDDNDWHQSPTLSNSNNVTSTSLLPTKSRVNPIVVGKTGDGWKSSCSSSSPTPLSKDAPSPKPIINLSGMGEKPLPELENTKQEETMTSSKNVVTRKGISSRFSPPSIPKLKNTITNTKLIKKDVADDQQLIPITPPKNKTHIPLPPPKTTPDKLKQNISDHKEEPSVFNKVDSSKRPSRKNTEDHNTRISNKKSLPSLQDKETTKDEVFNQKPLLQDLQPAEMSNKNDIKKMNGYISDILTHIDRSISELENMENWLEQFRKTNLKDVEGV